VPLPTNFAGFPEPQYTKTPNLIFDVLLRELSGSQLRVLLFVVRRTMGWKKDHEFIPLSIACIQEGTGLSKEPVVDALRYLCESNLILRQKQRDEEGRQGITAYRLRFTSDAQEQDPESENPTLARVGKVGDKSDPGGGAYNNVLKEIKEIEPPTPLRPTLDTEPIDAETGEPYRHPEKRYPMRNWKKAKPERPHGMSDRMRALRESATAGAGEGVERLLAPQRTSATPQAPAMDFPARWNQLVPGRQVDPALMGRNPRAYQDPLFLERYDEICRKANELVEAGADITLGFLLSQDRHTEQYRWQQLLAGQLGWTIKKNGTAQAKPVDGAAIAAKMREEIRQRKLANAGTTTTDKTTG